MRAVMCALAVALAVSGAAAQDKAAKAPASAQPVAAAGETVKVSAKVAAIDQATRVVTLEEPNGQRTVLKVGEEARNFAQVKVGDTVNVEYKLAAVMSLKKSAGVRSATESTSMSRAKPGEKPAGTVVTEGSIVADVIAIDQAMGTVSVKGPAGRVVRGKVADKALLKDVKVGDQVELDYTSSLAIQVVPSAVPAKTK